MLDRRSLTFGAVAVAAAAVSNPTSRFADESRAATGRAFTIEITDFEFTGSDRLFSPGDRITWVNRDIAPHTVTAIDGSWDSGKLEVGEQWTVTITNGQAVDYLCRFHLMMKARLKIQQSA